MEKELAKGVIASLRSGVAPRTGTGLIEVGLHKFWEDIETGVVDMCLAGGTGCMLYVMGEYGRGKTFFCNYSRERLDKMGKGFVSSHIQIKGFETLADYLAIYKELVRNLELPDNDKKGLVSLLDAFVRSTAQKDDFQRFKDGTGISPTVLTKVSRYREFRLENFEEGYVTALDWMQGEKDIPARSLHLIREKGFSKLREDDVDNYLHAIKEIALHLGYEGLLVQIDEAEERTSEFSNEAVRSVLRNLKKIHNNLFQKEWFSKMIFMLAGTSELWSKYETLDEAQRQRMNILRFELPILGRDQYEDLTSRVISVYDSAFDTSLEDRISGNDIKAHVEKCMPSPEDADDMTPRDFLSRKPDETSALLSRLDQMRKDPRSTLTS